SVVNTVRIMEARYSGPTIMPWRPVPRRSWPEGGIRTSYSPARRVDGREHWWGAIARAFREDAGLSLSGWTRISDMSKDLRLISDAIEADARKGTRGGPPTPLGFRKVDPLREVGAEAALGDVAEDAARWRDA